MALLDEIRDRTRLKRLRMGQDAPDMPNVPSMPEIRVAQVPLTERESMATLMASARLEVPENLVGMQARQRAAEQHDLWQSLRDPEDLSRKLWPSVEQMMDDLEPQDVDYLFNNLVTIMEEASPALEGLTQEQLDDLKKAFVLIDWNGLSGRQWSALKLCLSKILPDVLPVRSLGTGSTSSSMTKNENDESTFDADPS